MKRSFAIALLAVAAWFPAARAEHANIDLRLIQLDPRTGQNRSEVNTFADQEPPLGGTLPRPLVKVKINEPLVLQFFLTNTYPHGEKKDVTVHFFVVRAEKPRQKTLPDLTRGVITEGRFKMNFKPKCRVGARTVFTLKEPGVYLLRVQTENTDSDHEHFSALDLQAE